MDNVTLIRVITGFAVVVIPLYFLPTFLARKKRQFVSILLLNIFLGWTFIGWIVALVWSVSADQQPTQVIVQQNPAAFPSSVFCSSCGKYSQVGAKFCASCGQSLIAVLPQ